MAKKFVWAALAFVAGFLLAWAAVLSTRSPDIDKPSVAGNHWRHAVTGHRQIDPDLKRSVNALLEAANYLAYVQNREQDAEYANHLYEQINWIRDLAEMLLPTENDWGGTNIVPFVPRQRA